MKVSQCAFSMQELVPAEVIVNLSRSGPPPPRWRVFPYSPVF